MPIQDSDRPYIKREEHSPLDPDKMYAELEEKIKNCGHPMDLGRIRAAYEMARVAHSGQLRKDGSPYLTHAVAAAGYLGRYGAGRGLDHRGAAAMTLSRTLTSPTPTSPASLARQWRTS